MTLMTRLYTMVSGGHVGTDSFGNRYFRDRRRRRGKRERRWVLYNGEVEASKVPPEWHAWLHHTVGDAPPVEPPEKPDWQKPHLPNMTGTERAHRPPGHISKGGVRDPATGDYESWHPPESGSAAGR